MITSAFWVIVNNALPVGRGREGGFPYNTPG